MPTIQTKINSLATTQESKPKTQNGDQNTNPCANENYKTNKTQNLALYPKFMKYPKPCSHWNWFQGNLLWLTYGN